MTGWADTTIEQLRAELDAYAGDDGMGTAEGWYTIEELAALYGCCRGSARNIVTRLLAEGRVEKGQRQARGSDGRRTHPTVYRMMIPE